MDRLESMSIFVAVVDAGSFSAASRRLGIPLATVSRKVGELESHLKTRLLIRSTRQLSLTEAGHSYLAACRRILDDVDNVERAAAGEYSTVRGELVVTAPVTFGRLHLVPLVADFLALYPEVDIRLILMDRLAHLLEEHVDVALRIGTLPDSSLVALRVGEVRRVICASPRYLREYGVPAHPRELAGHRCVMFDDMAMARSWTFGRGRAEETIAVPVRLVVNTVDGAIAAAVQGVGPTRALSYQVEDALQRAELELVLEDFEPAPWPVSLVHAGQAPLPLKLRAFLDFAAPRLRERLSQA